MKLNINVVGIAVGIIGVAYGLHSQNKMNRVATKLNLSINELDMNTSVNVSQAIIDTATEQAVTKEVSKLATQAASSVSNEITKNMDREVKRVITSTFNSLSDNVSTKLAEQVAAIDNDALSVKVLKKAEAKILDKFEGALDGALESFNKDLRNVGKVYYSMNDAMIKREMQKNMFFRM